MRTKSTRQRIDDLIAWLPPERKPKSVRVKITPATVRRFAKKTEGGDLVYRGVVVVPLLSNGWTTEPEC